MALACESHIPSPLLHTVVDGRTAMGTVLEISLVARNRDTGRDRIDFEFQQVEFLEAIVSRYRPDSQLNQINAAAGQPPIAVDSRLHDLILRSVELGGLTDGSFDVTVGPLISLWKDAADRDREPSDSQIEAARALVGFDRIALEAGKVGLEREGMSIDLGGIAKGYALDLMADRLRSSTRLGALLSFGLSSVWAIGAPPNDFGWRLLLRPPSPKHELGVLTLRDQALSVSSSLGQWKEIGGKRFGHVIDPRSGRPVNEPKRAAVVAETAAEAEALSTALVVLDPAAGLALVEARKGAEARIDDANGFVGETGGWRRATRYHGVLEPRP
jgi:thiamine biosynthesis lipoprotein